MASMISDRDPLEPDLQNALEWYISRLAGAALRPMSRQGYVEDYRHFLVYCARTGSHHWSVDVIKRYLVRRVTDGSASWTTVQRVISCVRKAFVLRGRDPLAGPGWRDFVRGIRRRARVPQSRLDAVHPVSRTALIAWAAQAPCDDLPSLRNRALILLGWTMALSGQELQSLQFSQFMQVPEGTALQLSGSHARTVLVYPAKRQYCDPMRAIGAWSQAAGLSSGSVFRSFAQDGTITTRSLTLPGITYVVQHAFDNAQLNASSLQSGFVTSALSDGVPLVKIHTFTRVPTATLARRFTTCIRPAVPRNLL